MEFRDLGSLLIESDGLSRPPGGARLSTALAVLLARAGEPVTTATLIHAIWGDDAPERSVKVLESHIWRLRKVLEPGRGPRGAPTVLLTDQTGYRLAVSPDKIDSRMLESASVSMRRLLGENNLAEALAISEKALSRWRGPYCDDVADTGWLTPIRARLSDIRLDLIECRAAALREAGQPELAVNELAAVIAENPLRERLWVHRILGLYQSGRQAAALDAFEHIRRVLADELGIDPGPELTQVHHQILNQDDQLRPRTGQQIGNRPVEVRLPSRRSTIIGRADDQAAVTASLDAAHLVTVLGPGGVGKTRLATEVAFSVRNDYPEGVWFVDLAPVDQPESVPAVVANTLGLRPVADTPTTQLIGDHLTSRRLLMVLDNCEHLLAGVAGFVDQILEVSERSKVLATSREPLEVPGERRYQLAPLDVPTPDSTPAEFSESAAVQLFVDRMGDALDRPDRSGREGATIARICAAVGGLPLGIELAAARARVFDLGEIADSLDGAPGQLTRSGHGARRHSNLLETVDWGYRLAGNDEQILHRRLAVLPGPFTLEAAARLCSIAPLSAEHALDLVGGLVHRSMLVSTRPTTPDRTTSFVQLVPIRAHADRELAEAERRQACAVRDRWVVGRITDSPDPGRAEQSAYYQWLEDNQASVRAVLRSTLVDAPHVDGLAMLWRLIFFWHDREETVEFLRWAELADAAMAQMRPNAFDAAVGQAVTGCAQALAHNTDAAEKALAQAIPILSHPPEDRVADAVRILLVVSVCAWTGDVFDWALKAASSVPALAEPADEHTVLVARSILAASALVGGDGATALAQADAVLADNIAVGNNMAALFANVTHSIAAKFSGDGVLGLKYCDEVLRTQKLLGTHNFSESFETRGSHFANAGLPDEAARNYGLSYALSMRQSREWPWHPGTDELLDEVRAHLGVEFERHWDSGIRMGEVDPVRLIDDLDLRGAIST
ncbi:AfsR/SARP family transcriptional regulator [Williamsia limnetica]|uniref:AfsR/SARP family transcriptional regulator n=1 Tax=Williamsia limnetica TaxID=882452 RepID=UPI0013147E76|nr:BTAD domain-containing putative transcriptional regulator [Williamsia limnetica]